MDLEGRETAAPGGDTPRRPAFDSHADDYEAQLMQGLRISGESKEFFARGRLDFVRDWWRGSGRPSPARIVDYGCGIGDVTALLAEYFPGSDVCGLDPSSRCVELARERYAAPRVHFAVFDDGAARGISADLVHLNGVVHHVAPGERPALFADLARRVAPGGALALFENNPVNPGTRLVMSRTPFDRDAVMVPAWEARRRLRQVGLQPIRTGYLFYFPRALAPLRPLERFLVRLPLGAQYGVIASAAGAGPPRAPRSS
jgi:SAM-dependent methyltransferase